MSSRPAARTQSPWSVQLAWRPRRGRPSAFQISASAAFAPGWADRGRALSTLAILWNQHRCSRVSGKLPAQRAQNPSAPSLTASTRRTHVTSLARAQQVEPGLGGLPVPVVEGAEELLQRRTQVAAGQTVEVQQRQHLSHLRRLPGPRRQDRRGEPRPLTRVRVDALVVDPRRPHWHRAGRRGHFPRLVVAVADYQPVAVLVELVGARCRRRPLVKALGVTELSSPRCR